MKSLLQEATSIQKAVEKAWVEAGKPAQFTINILEKGEKNILGMTKLPAVVSISFELEAPKRSFERNKPRKPEIQRQRQQRSREHQPQEPRQSHQPTPKNQPPKPKNIQQEQKQDLPKPSWNKNLIQEISDGIKEILSKISLNASFDIKANNKALTVKFQGKVLEKADDERALFASLSYLLLQFLKKKHKRKFAGFRLIITSEQTAFSNR